jgi:thiamine-monophosphate kinase
MTTEPPDAAQDDERWVVERAATVSRGLTPGAGVGDDAAALPLGNLVTVDTMVEHVHWDARLSPADVGWKLVAVNVSDIGAMGGRPRWATLALTLPRPLDRAWVDAFFDGLGEGLAAFGVVLVGGDTTRGAGRVVSLTVGGSAERPVPRSGARAGEDVWVTGVLGRSAAAFLRARPAAADLGWLRRPCPPVHFGALLGEHGLASAMMDLSDGLAVDLTRLCRASGVGARIEPTALPTTGTLAEATAFGEDYELLFTADPGRASAICSLAEMAGIRVSRIGSTTAAPTVSLTGAAWPRATFSHFGEEPA